MIMKIYKYRMPLKQKNEKLKTKHCLCKCILKPRWDFHPSGVVDVNYMLEDPMQWEEVAAMVELAWLQEAQDIFNAQII